MRRIEPTHEDELQFAAFFMGEGCLFIDNQGCCRAQVVVRDDDEDIIRWVEDRWGGFVSRRSASGTSNPGIQWIATRKTDLVKVCSALLKCTMPAKKMREVSVFHAAVETMGAHRRQLGVRGAVITPERRFRDMCNVMLRELKKYDSGGCRKEEKPVFEDRQMELFG